VSSGWKLPEATEKVGTLAWERRKRSGSATRSRQASDGGVSLRLGFRVVVRRLRRMRDKNILGSRLMLLSLLDWLKMKVVLEGLLF